MDRLSNTQERPRTVHLKNTSPGHNKEYYVALRWVDGGWLQSSLYGPIDGTKAKGTAMGAPADYGTALKAFEKLVKDKRTKSGYEVVSDSWATDGETANAPAIQETKERSRGIPFNVHRAENGMPREDTGLRPMLLDELEELPSNLIADARYWLQPKRDGERTFVVKESDGSVRGAQRHGLTKPLLMQVVDAALRVNAASFILDGELVGEVFVAFDLLQVNGTDFRAQTYDARLRMVSELVASANHGALEAIATHKDMADKERAFQRYQQEQIEGVVFKLAAGKYMPGNGNGNFKHKFWKTASCLITQVNTDRASVRMGLYGADGKLVDVGAISINGNREAFAVGQIVEVKYLYVLRAHGKLYQAGILRVRDDVDARDCTIARQLKYRGAA